MIEGFLESYLESLLEKNTFICNFWEFCEFGTKQKWRCCEKVLKKLQNNDIMNQIKHLEGKYNTFDK